jgi:hypothetical protein
VTGGSFVSDLGALWPEGDLGALWPETWYFLGGAGFDEDSVGDAESRSRREEADVPLLDCRGALKVLGNLGGGELDTSREFMLISIIVWYEQPACGEFAAQKRQRAIAEALDCCLLLP